MAVMENPVEEVKAALAGGIATSSTVATLQSLFGTTSPTPASTTSAAGSSTSSARVQKSAVAKTTSSRTGRTARPPAGGAKKVAFVAVLEDEPKTLSPKGRYALATEVVNISLKVLQAAAKSGRCSQPNGANNGDTTPGTPSSRSPKALQVRSSNTSPAKPANARHSDSKLAANRKRNEVPAQTVPWSATAECARLAFSQLRTADRQNLGIRPLPKFQLETGMLSLVGRMIALGLDGLAAKELYAIKKRLQALPALTTAVEEKQSAPRAEKATVETLASLLHLNLAAETTAEAAPLCMTYWSYVLHLLANCEKPLAIEDAIPYLELNQPASAVSLIIKHTETIADDTKARKQLDALFLALMRFCPAVSASADDLAKDARRCIRPTAAFRVHAIALFVRMKMLKLSNCSEDLIEPFSKAMAALLRRLPPRDLDADVLELCVSAYQSLGFDPADVTPNRSSAAFTISRSMSLLAEQTGASERAFEHAEHALKQCAGLEANHARHVAGLVRLCSSTAALCKPSNATQDRLDDGLRKIAQALQQSLSGSGTDYESLLAELAHLLGCFNGDLSQDLHRPLIRAAAAFASRYARLSPGKQTQSIADIITKSLEVSKSTEDLLAWVTKDTAHALSQSGALRLASTRLSHEPLMQAWSYSRSAVVLGRVLKGVVTKAAATPAERSVSMLYIDQSLAPNEQGAALEWQLHVAGELAHKTKYKQSLRSIIPELLRQLMQVYDASTFPIRRARVAATMMQCHAFSGDRLSPELLDSAETANSIHEDQLGQDDKLIHYLADVRISLTIAHSFENGGLSTSAMEEHIGAWQKMLDGVSSLDALHRVVESPASLARQLISLVDYFGMLGYSRTQLQLSCLLCQVQRLLSDQEQLCSSALHSVRAYLLQGYAEHAASALQEAESHLTLATNISLASLDYHITRAQYLLCVDKLDECSVALQRAAEVRSGLAAESIRSQQSKVYRLHHVRGWMVQSQYLFASGNPKQALHAAKRSVKVANSIWAGLEKSNPSAQVPSPQPQREHDARAVDTLAGAISKLNLKPRDVCAAKSSTSCPSTGAAFWDVVPLMCQALMHLTDVFAHLGVFVEANYASEHAIKIAEGVRSHELLSRIRYHRCILLASAGKVEDAELCLAHEQDLDRLLSPLTKVQQQRAKAAISTKIGDHEDALTFLRKAEAIVKNIQSVAYIASLGPPDTTQTTGAPSGSAQKVAAAGTAATTTKRSTASKKVAKTTRTPASKSTKKTPAAPVPKESTAWGSCYILQKLEAQIMLQSTLLSTKLGRSDGHSFAWLADYCQIFPDSFSRRMLSYLADMQQVEAAIGADFTFNALAESTIAFPALRAVQRRLSLLPTTLQPTDKKPAKTTRPSKGKKQSEASLLQMLLSARQQLQVKESLSTLLTTSDIHKLYAALADASMLLSATSAAKATEVLHPVREAMNVELPRIHAARCLSVAAKLEIDINNASDLLLWPQREDASSQPQLSAREFQDDYVNILPKPWTAVSLSLNEEGDELYITRYRAEETPLLLRLPFSRQKSDDDDDDLFDFRAGRAELQEIIELSNYSCHNSMDFSVKGAKTNWWSEREALDRRLQEFLINIENLWLGGFRGTLSLHETDDARLEQFRVAFDSILDRHLSSRKVRGSKKIALDDQVLGLFIGLGTDSEGDVDLDEPLADLLYFVVDMLQFNGERNAYDEIDFDSMAIETLDALRVYYDDAAEQKTAAHLILVLDRRLQAFPWESLPCLEKTSVSRVDSMLTLRERVVAMKTIAQGYNGDGIHTVSRHSGAYVLNPSGDLTSTQTMLAPELSELTQATGSPWTAVVGREPSEEVFKAALQTSSNFLYFGHGAGSQYIRPRTIRKLETCSDVVWLMGCSSGTATEYDDLESSSVPLAYLQAGQSSSETPSQCMAVLATLWDVTDKDIDRFSLAVGQEWGLWQTAPEPSKAPTKTPRKRTVAAAATPDGGARAPKTPKVRKTPAAARTPARSQTRVMANDGRKQSLVEAVAKARDACFLRYLNGAAPVVYGVPIYLGD